MKPTGKKGKRRIIIAVKKISRSKYTLFVFFGAIHNRLFVPAGCRIINHKFPPLPCLYSRPCAVAGHGCVESFFYQIYSLFSICIIPCRAVYIIHGVVLAQVSYLRTSKNVALHYIYQNTIYGSIAATCAVGLNMHFAMYSRRQVCNTLPY